MATIINIVTIFLFIKITVLFGRSKPLPYGSRDKIKKMLLGDLSLTKPFKLESGFGSGISCSASPKYSQIRKYLLRF